MAAPRSGSSDATPGGQIVAELTGAVPVEDLQAVGRMVNGLPLALRSLRREVPAPRPYDVAAIRERHPNAYARWSDQDDERLRVRHGEGATVAELTVEFGRQPSGIRSRLARLGLEANEPTERTPPT